jgi:hypothetical protein
MFIFYLKFKKKYNSLFNLLTISKLLLTRINSKKKRFQITHFLIQTKILQKFLLPTRLDGRSQYMARCHIFIQILLLHVILLPLLFLIVLGKLQVFLRIMLWYNTPTKSLKIPDSL